MTLNQLDQILIPAPQSWREAPVCILDRIDGNVYQVRRVELVQNEDGDKIIVISHERLIPKI